MRIFFTLSLLFSFVLAQIPSKACGGGEWEYSYQFFFPSDLLSDTSLVRYFPDWTVCDDCGQALQQAIVQEWKEKYPSCSEDDIRIALFEYLSKEHVDQLKEGVNPFPKNALFQQLLDNKQDDIVAYLDFILDENKLMVGEGTNWKYSDWEEQTKNTGEGLELAKLAKENLAKTSDPFLRQRYVFQIVKLLHYSEKFQEAIHFFDSTYSAKTGYAKSLTYYRTLGYFAGAQRKAGNTQYAKYLFAKIFDQSLPLRYRAYKDFKYIDQEAGEWEKSLAFATSNSEKSALLVARNIYDFEIDIESLEELYATDSSYTRLELGLIKQLNSFHYGYYIPELKKEIALDTNKLVKEFSLAGEILRRQEARPTHWWEWIWFSIAKFFKNLFHMQEEGTKTLWKDEVPNVKYVPFAYKAEWIPELLSLLNKIIAEKKTQNTDLYVLAKGYMEIAKGDFESGKKTVGQLSSSTQPSIAQLSEYLTLWASLLSAEYVSEELENKIIAHLKKYGNPYEIKIELGRRYFVEKRYNKAFLVLGLDPSDHFSCAYFSDQVLEDLIAHGSDGLGKPFVSYFGTIDTKKLQTNYANRLFLKGLFEQAKNVKNDKLAFHHGEEDMGEVSYAEFADWERRGHQEDYLSIATALATSTSMPYNSEPCYNYYPYSYSQATNYPFNIKGLAENIENRHHYLGKLNYSTDLAEIYYRKVYDLLKTDEQKAEILVNAQEVAMKDKYALKDLYNQKESDRINKALYYKELNEKYANTSIVQELNQSCSFLRNEKITYY